MTKDQDQLLKNVATLVCSLAQSKANRISIGISKDLCDGPSGYRAIGVKGEKKSLEEYQELIDETRKLAAKG